MYDASAGTANAGDAEQRRAAAQQNTSFSCHEAALSWHKLVAALARLT
jgi:hypothetical protein